MRFYFLIVAAVLSKASLALGDCSPPLIPRPDGLIRDQNAVAGQNVRFCQGSHYGTEPVYYQWVFNGTPIPGATNPCITITNVQAGEAGFYQMLLTNACGSTMSTTDSFSAGYSGKLTVGFAPAIVSPPQNMNVVTGQTATFSVIVTGSPPISYSWSYIAGVQRSLGAVRDQCIV